MTSRRWFSIVLLVVAALLSVMAVPAHAQGLSLNCNQTSFPNSMTVNASYNMPCTASGGTAPYTFSISQGAIPSGMSSFQAGSQFNITGTPQITGSYSFTVTVQDVTQASQSLAFAVTVAAGGSGTGITLSSLSQTTATAGVQFTLVLTGSGFTSNCVVVFNGSQFTATFTSSSSLTTIIPASAVVGSAGATLPVYVRDTSTGAISNTLNVTITSGGSSGVVLSSISPTSTGVGSSGVTLTLFGSGFSSGMLVSFGTLYSTSALVQSSAQATVFIPASVLTTAQTVNVTIGGSNAVPFTIGSGTSGTLSISCTPSIGPSVIGNFFTQTCTVSGGNGTYIWSVSGLPTGVSQATTSGQQLAISGTPTTAGSYSYAIQASDSAGHAGSLTITGVLGSSGTSGYNITQVSPSSVSVGASDTVITVLGNGFTPSSSVYFNASVLVTQYVNSSQLNATIPAAVLSSSQTASISVNTGGNVTNALPFTVGSGGGGGGGGVSVTSLSPSSVATGSPGFTLTINGSGFTQGALVNFGSNTLSSTFVSSSQVSVFIPASYLTTSQTVNVSVAGSNTLQFVIGAGSSGGSLTVTCSPTSGPTTLGASYTQTCSVNGGTSPFTWNVTGLPGGLTQSASTGSSVTISGATITTGGYSYTVSVTDGSASHLTGSTTITGSVSSSSYGITSLSPSSVAAGSPGITLSVVGNGFSSASQVYFNGGQLSTTFVSSGQLNAAVPTSLLTNAQTASVTVITSGVTSNAATFTIGSGSGTGAGGLTVVCTPGVGPSVINTSYSTSCTVSGGTQPYNWPTPPGLPAYLTYSSTTGTTITISGTPGASAAYNFTVTVSDSSTPAQSGSLQLAGQTGTNSSATGSVLLTSLSPNSVAVNSPTVTLTVTGTGFTSSSQIVFDGFPIATSFVNSGQLTAMIPAGQLTFARSALVSVTTPAGGTSNALTFVIGNGGVGVQMSITCAPGVGPSSPNSSYTANCGVNGGTTPYTWSISSGSLPTGLTLTPNGPLASISGYTTLNGQYSYTLKVTDGSSPAQSATLVFAGETGAGSGGSSYSISSLSPSSAAVGASSVTLTVSGTGFNSSSVVYFSGSPLSTTFVNAGQLTATIPASSLTQAQSASITVITSGVTSNALTFTVGTAATTGITISCNPTVGPSTSGSVYTTTCTASGGKAPYTWSGVNIPTGLAVTNSTSATVSITGTLFSGPYNYNLQVSDSSSPAQSATYPFVGNIPTSGVATISSMSPISAQAGSGQLTLTLTGSGFVSGVTQVQFGSTLLATTVNSATQLTAIVPANLIANFGPVAVQLSGTGSNSADFFVTSGAASGVSPSALTFTYGIGGAVPAAQTLSVTSINGATGFSIVPTTTSGGSWLTVSQASGAIPGSVSVSVSPTNLAIGTYMGSLTLTGFAVGTSVVIPVTFTVTGTPTLSASPTNVTLNAVPGGTASQTVNVTSTDSTTVFPYSVSVFSNNGGNWASVSPATGNTPGSFTITANATNLVPSTYSAIVTLTSTGTLSSQITIAVTLVVSLPGSIGASPSSLSFTSAVGQNPATQSISVTAAGNSAVAYTVASTTQKGGNWLSATASGTTPGTIVVSVNAGSLAADTYPGTITITAPGATNSPLTVPVTLVLTSGPSLSPTPPNLTFNYAGGTNPAAQTVSIAAPSGGALTFSASATTSSGGNWLSVSPTGGTTPGSLSVSVNPSGLGTGSYTGSLTVSASGVGSATIPVTLNVQTSSLITAPSSLSFLVPGDGSAPAAQTVSVFSTGTTTAFTTSATSQGGNWLTVSGGGTTPASFTATVNPAGLTPGQVYNGSITITAPALNPTTIQVPVTLSLAATGTVAPQVIPQSLLLSYTQGAGSDLQHVLVLNNGGGTINYTAQAQAINCGNWLSIVTPNGSATASTPGLVAFNVNPSSVTSQTCRGQVTINDGRGNVTNVPVYMAISGQTQAILLSQTGMNFVAAAGGAAPASQTLQILNPGTGALSWNLSTQVLSGGSWLSATPSSGSSQSLAQPGSPVTVSVNHQGLSAGIYYGTVQVSSQGTSPQLVTVSLTVTASGSPSAPVVRPSGIVLTGSGGSSDTQMVNITNASGSMLTFSTAVVTDDGQSWLTASPSTGSVAAGGTASINVSAGGSSVSAGLRHGMLRIAFSNGTVQTVDVKLAVAGTPGSAVSGVTACGPSNLAMEFVSPSQYFQASARTAVPLQVLVKDCSGNALTSSTTGVDVVTGASDIRLNYIGNGMWAGTWTPPAAMSVIQLTARAVSVSGTTTATGLVTATGQASAAAANAAPFVGGVVNAGSFLLPGLVAPGTMVSIFGSGLADGGAQVFTVPYPNTLQGAQFTIRGMPLPLFYTSDGQVNAVMPIGLNPNERDQLIVVRDTTQSVPVDLLVADFDPGIFATNQQGTGQGAILLGGTSQIAGPEGSVEGAAPATAGQFVSIFIAGLGTVTNPPADGSASNADNASTTPTNPVVTIGGIPATVSYSGLAPGEVGLYQINVQVPTGVPTGDVVPVVVNMGNAISNTVTIAIK